MLPSVLTVRWLIIVSLIGNDIASAGRHKRPNKKTVHGLLGSFDPLKAHISKANEELVKEHLSSERPVGSVKAPPTEYHMGPGASEHYPWMSPGRVRRPHSSSAYLEGNSKAVQSFNGKPLYDKRPHLPLPSQEDEDFSPEQTSYIKAIMESLSKKKGHNGRPFFINRHRPHPLYDSASEFSFGPGLVGHPTNSPYEKFSISKHAIVSPDKLLIKNFHEVTSTTALKTTSPTTTSSTITTATTTTTTSTTTTSIISMSSREPMDMIPQFVVSTSSTPSPSPSPTTALPSPPSLVSLMQQQHFGQNLFPGTSRRPEMSDPHFGVADHYLVTSTTSTKSPPIPHEDVRPLNMVMAQTEDATNLTTTESTQNPHAPFEIIDDPNDSGDVGLLGNLLQSLDKVISLLNTTKSTSEMSTGITETTASTTTATKTSASTTTTSTTTSTSETTTSTTPTSTTTSKALTTKMPSTVSSTTSTATITIATTTTPVQVIMFPSRPNMTTNSPISTEVIDISNSNSSMSVSTTTEEAQPEESLVQAVSTFASLPLQTRLNLFRKTIKDLPKAIVKLASLSVQDAIKVFGTISGL